MQLPIMNFDNTINRLGANYLGDGRCGFLVWAPGTENVKVHLLDRDRLVSFDKVERGYHQATIEDVAPGALYQYRLDGGPDLPDPASRAQPRGVHGPSAVSDAYFDWEDQHWFGIPLEQYVLYELHVGTYTSAGTFEAIIPHLDRLKDLGVTAVELMPVAQFPGERNWGYDGVFPFAVQNSYGGPSGLRKLVNACHQTGLAVVLDVVYNHMGPEGNTIGQFGPYFTDRYRTPWGQALNFDGAESDEVRRYFIENALYWITDLHFDGLRLDAVHAILDHSPRTFLEDLAETVHTAAKRLNRQVFLFPESAANDSRLIRAPELGGWGMDAQWNDDFHHSLRVALTGERAGYYMDYDGVESLAKAFREGFVYSGEYSAYRRRSHGTSSKDIPAERFVIFSQNHDQVGNRMLGERSSQLISFEQLKLAAGTVLLSPFVPLLFMGEEYGETAPFQYFISHTDPGLVEAVRNGRKEEFASFGWQEEPPDPQAEATFLRGKLDHELRAKARHRHLMEFYRQLIRLRKTIPALSRMDKAMTEVVHDRKKDSLILHRWYGTDEICVLFCFNVTAQIVPVRMRPGLWVKEMDSSDAKWQGGGSSLPDRFRSSGERTLHISGGAFVLYRRQP
jgi:maltooligosyltrehalose trehalohydrolase